MCLEFGHRRRGWRALFLLLDIAEASHVADRGDRFTERALAIALQYELTSQICALKAQAVEGGLVGGPFGKGLACADL